MFCSASAVSFTRRSLYEGTIPPPSLLNDSRTPTRLRTSTSVVNVTGAAMWTPADIRSLMARRKAAHWHAGADRRLARSASRSARVIRPAGPEDGHLIEIETFGFGEATNRR